MRKQLLLAVFFISVFSNLAFADEPYIVRVTDSLGNQHNNSEADDGTTLWDEMVPGQWYCPTCYAQIGDTLSFTTLTNQKFTQYQCKSGGNAANLFRDWSTTTTCSKTLTDDDYGLFTVWIYMKDADETYRYTSVDDFTRLYYWVTAPGVVEPKIVSVVDDSGNSQSNSQAGDGSTEWDVGLRPNSSADYCSDCIVQEGQNITFTINADQEGLFYYCYSSGDEFLNWSMDTNSCTLTVPEASEGSELYVYFSVRNNGLFVYPVMQADDHTTMVYRVVSANQPSLLNVTDSLGNVQTNSRAVDAFNQWDEELLFNSSVNYCANCIVYAGDVVTFTANADQEGLEYQCSSNWTVIRDAYTEVVGWNPSNVCNWRVEQEDANSEITFGVKVRNNDGVEEASSADDYTWLIYKVLPAPPKIVNVTDSLGNVQSNSKAGDGTTFWDESQVINYSQQCANCFVQVGDVINFTIEGDLPDLRHACHKNSSMLRDAYTNSYVNWITGNKCSWNVTEEDLGLVYITTSLRNTDENHVYPPFSADDYTTLRYVVLPANVATPVPTITPSPAPSPILNASPTPFVFESENASIDTSSLSNETIEALLNLLNGTDPSDLATTNASEFTDLITEVVASAQCSGDVSYTCPDGTFVILARCVSGSILPTGAQCPTTSASVQTTPTARPVESGEVGVPLGARQVGEPLESGQSATGEELTPEEQERLQVQGRQQDRLLLYLLVVIILVSAIIGAVLFTQSKFLKKTVEPSKKVEKAKK